MGLGECRSLGLWRGVCALTGIAFLSGTQSIAQSRPFKVIVNAENQVAALKRSQVALLFLDRKARWSFGADGAPIDQSLASPVREAFSKEVLGQLPAAVQNYWQKRMLAEREFPPPVKTSDEEVIGEVAKRKGGIGYVSADATLPATVKVLSITE